MAKLEQMLEAVGDQALRAQLEGEIASLKSRTRFGLVFERHLPETIIVGDIDPLSVGDHVRPRDTVDVEEDYLVVALDNGQARILSLKTHEEIELERSALLVVKRFGDPAYAALAPLGAVSRSVDRPYHSVICGENYHALQLLGFTHAGQVDCIYIDPPYNTGARDWEYNNNYVDENDLYRHSKWLSMMERRLHLAKRLLKPDGALVVTIDWREVHHLGVLLEEVFSGYDRQMITCVINPSGQPSTGLNRVDEHLLSHHDGGYATLAIRGQGCGCRPFRIFTTRMPDALPGSSAAAASTICLRATPAQFRPTKLPSRATSA